MLEKDKTWRNRELREHISVVDGVKSPTLILKNSTYLNIYTKQWVEAHVWIFNDRIVYVGDELPKMNEQMEVVDCTGKYLVPGYIEPHAHPFQLYNPEEIAIHAAKYGTTTLVNDNIIWNYLLDKKKAFTLIENLNKLPVSMYWWVRYDSQTALQREEDIFSTEDILAWAEHHLVVQGGEVTSWPRLLDGDDRLLYWIQETKRLGKPVEGHLPGASKKTLTKMKLLGISADHESITGEDVINRLELGYQVGLRYSSIRPDLGSLLTDILAKGIHVFDSFTMTTDGSPPSFYEEGLLNQCIKIAIDSGVPIEEAYMMATYNAAKHFGLDEQLGSIAPGRIAHINILDRKDNPDPVSVLAKGNWIVKDQEETLMKQLVNWEEHDIKEVQMDWDSDLDMNDLQFSLPIGLEMKNDVIMQPCTVQFDSNVEDIAEGREDAFLLLIDRYGKWRVNTMIRGFTNRLGALVSSYSTTGDFITIGKNKVDILLAWKRMKELGGGIVLAHEGEIIFELPLELGGMMSNLAMRTIIEKEKELKRILNDFGYRHNDPVYNILFLSSTHLPYIRITQQGIIDVIKDEIIFPAIMR